MKRTLFLLLSLFAFTNGEVARISTEKYGGTDCPNGLTGNNCEMSANAEPSASDHQYTFLTIINYKTQMLPKASAPTDDQVATLAALEDVSAASGNRFVKSTVTLLEIGGQRYEGCGVKYDVSDLANYAQFVAMNGADDSGHVAEMTTFLNGEAPSSGKFTAIGDAGNPTGYKCEFYVQNNMYLGSAKIAVAFQKTSTTTATGDSRLTKLHASLKFVPGSDDPNFEVAATKGFITSGFQNEHMRDLTIAYADSCFSTAGYLRNDKDGAADCKDYTLNNGVTTDDNDVNVAAPSSASAGTVTLRLTGTFLDPRYKVVSQSGVETLQSGIGNLLLIKEGLELHQDYRSFNDATKDVRHNGGDGTVTMNPVNFRLRKRSGSTVMKTSSLEGSATEKDVSNVGQALGAGDAPQLQNYYGDVANLGSATFDAAESATDYLCEIDDGSGTLYDISTDAATRGECHAQYVLNHQFEFKYGDLPHFKPGYIGCDICESVIAIKAFKEDVSGTDKYQVNTRLSISVQDLPVAPNSINIKTVNLEKKQDQFALAPSVNYKMGELFAVTQSAQDLLQVSGALPSSLDDSLNFFTPEDTIGNGFLNYESNKPDGAAASSKITLDSSICPTLMELKLRDLGTDTRAAVEALLASDCQITVPNNFYGTDYKLKFSNSEAENVESVVTIRETDARVIMIGSSQLNLINRVEAEILRVATTITMDLTKTLPTGTIPDGYANEGNELSTQTISFRLKGDKGDFAGFVSTADGGRECAGDQIYWKSQTDRAYKLPAALAGSDASYDTGGPWGVCADITTTGLTPAPLGTQPLAPVPQVGELLTYEQCKGYGGNWEITSVADVTVSCTQSGDSLVAADCSLDKNTDKIGVHLGCTAAAIQEEVLFVSSPNNGEVKKHSIRSTDQCTGKLDLQLEDQTQYQEFAIYRTRIECSRVSTQELSDDVRLVYNYATTMDLADNSLEITADYTSSANTAGKCNDDQYTEKAACEGASQTWTMEYAIAANFGTCSSANDIDTVTGCTGVKFIKDEGNSQMKLVMDDVNEGPVTNGLQVLQACHDTGNAIQVTYEGLTDPRQIPSDPDARNTIASYIITYDLATQYSRTLLNDAFDIGGVTQVLKYCDDQQFTATIRRDAKASTNVAQIKAASLNRAIIVSDIGWVGNADGDYTGSDCSQANEYQLEVIMRSMDQDGRDASGAWAASKLTKAFIDTASDAQNDNKMKIHKPGGVGYGILKDTTPTVMPYALGGDAIDADGAVVDGSYFKVRSECVVVSACEADADNTVDGDSWGDLTSLFKTDLVIRGTFLSSDVDSKIELTLDFDECPLDGAADVTGETRVGLQIACSDADADQATAEEKLLAKSLAQIAINTHDVDQSLYQTAAEYETATGVIDCSQAFADDVVRVSGFVFATKSGCSDAQSNPNLVERAADGSEDYDADCALVKDAYDAASAQQWKADIVDVFIDRYDTSGSTPLLTSSTRICKCETADGTLCEVDQTSIIGLDAFVQYSEAATTFAQYQACGFHGSEANDASSTAEASNTALDSATGGALKMKHQFPLMPLSAATSDLFKVRYEVVMVSDAFTRRRLRTTQHINLKSGSASSEATSNGFKVLSLVSETAESAPVQDTSAPANETEQSEPDHEHDLSGGAIAGIVLGSISVIALGALLIVNSSRSASGSDEEREAMMEDESSSDSAFRESRFRNLRY
jgi:hypothetical protein